MYNAMGYQVRLHPNFPSSKSQDFDMVGMRPFR